MTNVDIELRMPKEALNDNQFHKFKEEIQSLKGCQINEEIRLQLNFLTREFDCYLKDVYRDSKGIHCILKGDLAYFKDEWTVKHLCKIYKKYCPEQYEEKEEYTVHEVTKMLIDLRTMDIIYGFSIETRKPYEFISDAEDTIYDKSISVLSRYFID